MPKRKIFNINNNGELEVIILYEAHNLLAELIHTDFYKVYGKKPNQQASINNSICYDLFVIKMVELISESTINIAGKNEQMSILDGIKWLCFDQYPHLGALRGLRKSFNVFAKWLSKEIKLNFYCGELNINFQIKVKRQKIIKWSANLSKHSILRLSSVIGQLEEIYQDNGYTLDDSQILATKQELHVELRDNILAYHFSYIVEMLGNIFYALNNYIRYRETQCKRIPLQDGLFKRDFKYPENIGNDFYRNLYENILILHCYTDDRILSLVPTTTKLLRKRY